MKWLEQFEPVSNTTNVKAIYEIAGIVDGLGDLSDETFSGWQEVFKKCTPLYADCVGSSTYQVVTYLRETHEMAYQEAVSYMLQEMLPLFGKPIFWHSKHIQLWDYLSKHSVSKREAFKALNFPSGVLYNCFACHASDKMYGNLRLCKCPLDWGAGHDCRPCLRSHFAAWEEADTEEYEYYLARMIRDLPFSKHIDNYFVK